MKRPLLLAAMFSAIASASTSAFAQGAYPAKPVRIVVGFPPGSVADIVARVVAARLSEDVKQNFVVDNRPGAGSNIAAEHVVRAASDGYTLFMATVASAINASLYRNLTFDLVKDLVPVARIASAPNVLVIHPSLPVQSLKELIALARSHPNELLYASSGNGTSAHLSAVLFNTMTGTKMTHVPYKGSPPAVTDLVVGRVQLMFAPASSVVPSIKAPNTWSSPCRASSPP